MFLGKRRQEAVTSLAGGGGPGPQEPTARLLKVPDRLFLRSTPLFSGLLRVLLRPSSSGSGLSSSPSQGFRHHHCHRPAPPPPAGVGTVRNLHETKSIPGGRHSKTESLLEDGAWHSPGLSRAEGKEEMRGTRLRPSPPTAHIRQRPGSRHSLAERASSRPQVCVPAPTLPQIPQGPRGQQRC